MYPGMSGTFSGANLQMNCRRARGELVQFSGRSAPEHPQWPVPPPNGPDGASDHIEEDSLLDPVELPRCGHRRIDLSIEAEPYELDGERRIELQEESSRAFSMSQHDELTEVALVLTRHSYGDLTSSYLQWMPK